MRAFLRTAGLAIVIAAAVAMPASAQSASAFKVAFVNTQVIFDNAPGRTEAAAAFEREAQGLQDQVKRMSDSLNAMVADYRKVEATLTAAQKETRQRAIQSKQSEYEQRAQQIDQQAGQRREALMSPLLEHVRKAIEDIRAEDGYAFVMSNDPGASVVVAYDKNLDITDRVIARLKTMGPPKASAAAPAPANRPAPAGPTSAPAGVTRPRP